MPSACNGCGKPDMDMESFVCNECGNTFLLCSNCENPGRYIRKTSNKPLPRRNHCLECTTKKWEAANG